MRAPVRYFRFPVSTPADREINPAVFPGYGADGFILPCQPVLADRPPSGPGWLHEIKFDDYRVIARKDGDRVRLWARTTSDYSKAFTRIHDGSPHCRSTAQCSMARRSLCDRQIDAISRR
jgi:hypothetical protein